MSSTHRRLWQVLWGASLLGHVLVTLAVGVLLVLGQPGFREDGSPDLTLSMVLALAPSALGIPGAFWLFRSAGTDGWHMRRLRHGATFYLTSGLLLALGVSFFIWPSPMLLVLVPHAGLALWGLWTTRG